MWRILVNHLHPPSHQRVVCPNLDQILQNHLLCLRKLTRNSKGLL
ncbi:hypothetical protein LINPERPRIM_LOCUS25331 [Linum perenne]